MTRRELLTRLLQLAACGMLPVSFVRAATTGLLSTDGQAFSPDWLRETARQLAREPYTTPSDARPPWLTAMNWDDYQSLNNFRIDHGLWAGGELPFQARFFHLGLYFHHPVALYEVAAGQARPIIFFPEKSGPKNNRRTAKSPRTPGFAPALPATACRGSHLVKEPAR